MLGSYYDFASVNFAEVARSLMGIVLEKKQPISFACQLQEPAFRFQSFQRKEVITHNPRKRHMASSWNEIPEKDRPFSLGFHHDSLMAVGMPAAFQDFKSRFHFKFSFHQFQLFFLIEGHEIFGEVTGLVSLIRVYGGFPFFFLDDVA